MVSRCLPESAHWRGTDRETGLMGSDEPHEGGCTRHRLQPTYLRATRSLRACDATSHTGWAAAPHDVSRSGERLCSALYGCEIGPVASLSIK